MTGMRVLSDMSMSSGRGRPDLAPGIPKANHRAANDQP
jgi:hypothetical protein